MSPIETLADVKSRQVTEGNTRLGIDCAGKGNNGEFRALLVGSGEREADEVCLGT